MGKEMRKIHSFLTPAQGLLNGIPYAEWWRDKVREREGGRFLFEREQVWFQDLQVVPLIS
jgi:hypothetical protein